jgi:hypothetical protein
VQPRALAVALNGTKLTVELPACSVVAVTLTM